MYKQQLEDLTYDCLIGCLTIGTALVNCFIKNISCLWGSWKAQPARARVNHIQPPIIPWWSLPFKAPQRRRLSITTNLLDHAPSPELQNTADQSASFFSELPFEIREQIFKYVLFGQRSSSRAFHITRTWKLYDRLEPQKFRYWQCNKTTNDTPCRLANQWNGSMTKHERESRSLPPRPFQPLEAFLRAGGLGAVPVDPFLNSGQLLRSCCYDDSTRQGLKQPLSLMCTCRQAYTEMASILYKQPHFHFLDLGDVFKFRTVVSPSRFQMMRYVSLDLTAVHHMRYQTSISWAAHWDDLMSIDGLKELKVRPGVQWDPMWSGPVLPLQGFPPEVVESAKRNKTFEVVVGGKDSKGWRTVLGLEEEMDIDVVAAPDWAEDLRP